MYARVTCRSLTTKEPTLGYALHISPSAGHTKSIGAVLMGSVIQSRKAIACQFVMLWVLLDGPSAGFISLVLAVQFDGEALR